MCPERKLSVVIPVFNEEENCKYLIPELVEKLSTATDAFEIIVVDDSSTDLTRKVVEDQSRLDGRVRLISRNCYTRSLPQSILMGVQESRFSAVAWMDSDLSMPPEALAELASNYWSSNRQIVVGSRFVEGGSVKGSEPEGNFRLLRMAIRIVKSNDLVSAVYFSWLINRYLWLFLGRCCRDLTSGFVVCDKATVLKIGINGSYGDYFPRFIYFAYLNQCEILEIPYSCKPRLYGNSKTAKNILGLLRRGMPYVILPIEVRIRRNRHLIQ